MDAGLGMHHQANIGRRCIGHQHRDGKGTNPFEALVLLNVPLTEQRVQATNTGSTAHHQAFGVNAVGTGIVVGFGKLQAGVGPGLLGSDKGQLA